MANSNDDWQEVSPQDSADDWQEVGAESTPAVEATPISDTAIGALGGYTAGKVGQGLTKAVDSLVVPAMGELDKPQIDFISNNAKDYKSAPSLEALLDQWKQTSQGVQQTGIDSAATARKSLEGLPNIPAAKAYDALSVEPSNAKYSTAIDPGTKSEVFTSRFNEVKPEIDSLRGRNSEIDNLLKGLEEQRGLEVSDPTIALREKQANDSYDRKMASPNNTNQSDLNFRKYQTDEKLDLSKAKKEETRLGKIERELENLRKEKADALAGIDKRSSSSIDKARADYEQLSNAPRELGLPEDRFIRQEYSNQLKNAVDKIRPATNVGLEPVVADQIVQELRQGVDFDKQSDGVKGFNKGLSENFRQGVLDESTFPEYNKGMKTSSAAQNAQDAISKYTGVQYDKSSDNISFPEGSRTRLTSLLSDPSNASRSELIQELAKAEKAGVLPVGSAENFFKTGDSSVIKNIVNGAVSPSAATVGRLGKAAGKAGAGALAGGQIGGTTGAAIGAGAGLGAELYGTKLQELYALQKAGKLGTVAKAANSALPSFLGAAGAFAGAMGAANAGELSPAEAVVAGSAEAINPIPGTDVVEGAIQGRKDATAEAQNYEPSEELSTIDSAAPSVDSTLSNPVVQKALTGFAKGFTSPVPALAKMGVEAADSFGTNQSTEARSRMEQNLNALGSNKTLAGSKALNQATPEQLMELSETFKNIKGADTFVAPLENAAQASSESEKKARLFGLYQQPAFRQLLKRQTGEK